MKSVYSVISNTNLHHYPLNTKKYSFFSIKIDKCLSCLGLFMIKRRSQGSHLLYYSLYFYGEIIHETTTPLLVRYTNQPVPNANTWYLRLTAFYIVANDRCV